MAKRLEISMYASGGNIPSKRVYYKLHDLFRLTIQCLKDEITRISHESGCTEFVLTHRPRTAHPVHLLDTPHITFSRKQMKVWLNDQIGVTRIKIFYDIRATEITKEALLSFHSQDIFKDFIFDFKYVTKKGRVVPRINYSEECEDLLLYTNSTI